ncbi:MAG TPA: hypothetical protein VMW75_24090 [Thermoanaerobaculia bacterium]|nr:hypothetical protein [Thermoanaerobaculia bacterium]
MGAYAALPRWSAERRAIDLAVRRALDAAHQAPTTDHQPDLECYLDEREFLVRMRFRLSGREIRGWHSARGPIEATGAHAKKLLRTLLEHLRPAWLREAAS